MSLNKRFFTLATCFHVAFFSAFAYGYDINNIIGEEDEILFRHSGSDQLKSYGAIVINIRNDTYACNYNENFLNLINDIITNTTLSLSADSGSLTLHELLAFKDLVDSCQTREGNYQIVIAKRSKMVDITLGYAQRFDYIEIYRQPEGIRCSREKLSAGKTIVDAIRGLPEFQQRKDKVAQEALEMYGKVKVECNFPCN